jgi:putative DNA primase/helicase
VKVSASDLKMFASIGVDQKLVEAAGIVRVDDSGARALGITLPGDMSGIAFPYFVPGANGHRATCRLRRDHPEESNGKPENKYVCPTGDRKRLYFPPGAAELLAADPKSSIIFVEAEKSALAITAWAGRVKHNVVAIATGGCWGWRSKTGIEVSVSGKRKPKTGPSPDLAYAEGRAVAILFDANAAKNENVQTARKAFATALAKIAARVAIVELPEGDWNGPDDYIAANGDAAMVELFTKPAKANDAELPVIKVMAGAFPATTTAAEKVLVDHAEELKLFQRAGELVCVIRLPEARKRSGLKRPQGTLMLEPTSDARLREMFASLIDFRKYNERKGDWLTTDCPAIIVSTYQARKGSWNLPVLVGTIAAPLMKDDGTVLSKPGYDKETGLYLDSECEWLPMPGAPSRKDAEAALGILEAPFLEFPFETDEDRSVAIAAVLTALQRRVLPACPLFGYSAPASRSGKSLLAEAAPIIAMGKPAPATACSTDKEEFKKALLAVLREGQLVTNLDNIERPLKSPQLCMIITQEEYQDRLLGENTSLSLPTNVLWTATGNNLSFQGDLANRALLCRIDAKRERPEERTFAIPDLKAHLLKHRRELVHAALTILRAFHVAGRPKQDVKAWGGFDEWSRSIREALVWAGAQDPSKTRERILSEDPEKESTGVALVALASAFGDEEFTSVQAAEKANEKVMKSFTNNDLHDALKAVTGGNQEIDSGRLGWWMRSCRGRFVGGLTIQRANKENTHPAKWKIGIMGRKS